MLDLLELLVEGIGLLFDIVGWIVDGVAWFRSRGNRKDRRQARHLGEQPPPRNAWSWVLLVLTPVLIMLTLFLLWRWARGKL